MSQTRVLRSKGQEKAVQEGKRVETANSLLARDFFNTYCAPEAVEALGRAWTQGEGRHAIHYLDAAEIHSTQMVQACLDLIESTSAADYKNSEMGWSRAKKEKEMLLPDMKYIVLADTDSTSPNPIPGFVSFMVTYEDGLEVVYVYEIHVAEQQRGTGLGKALINSVEAISRKVGVAKIMLTVFRANSHAMEWYHRLGYGVDDFSPGPRRLRNGTIKEPSYAILSKTL